MLSKYLPRASKQQPEHTEAVLECSRGHEDAKLVADVALRVARQEHAGEEAVMEAHEVLHSHMLHHVRICGATHLSGDARI